MIAFLDGIVAGKTLNEAYINVHGVGYLLSMSQTSLSNLPPVGSEAHVLCHLIVSDSGVALYGFATEEEKQLFEQLITVGGIGPKIALSALSFMSPANLVAAIVSQDTKTIAKIPGIGKKSASRIILELKDKFPEFSPREEDLANVEIFNSPAMDAVREALVSMGFTDEEVAYACKDADDGLSESAMLQYALKRLG